jgi:hypothetical protein
MRLSLSLLLLLVLAGLCGAELVKTPTQYLLLKPKKAVVVDGKLDEWDMNTPYVISATRKDPLSMVSINDPTCPVKGDADFSGRAAVAWDETYLYVAGEMTDDQLLGVKPDSLGNQGPAGWFCDSLMVSVASFRQPMKTNSPFSAYPFIGLRYAPMGANPRGALLPDPQKNLLDKRDLYWILPDHSKWAVTETAKGYNVEAAIPWAELQFTPRVGERIFLAFLAADMDPGQTLKQVGWGFVGDPKAHPVFRLADGDPLLGLLTISTDQVAADKAWAVRAELDAVKGDARIDSVRVVDAGGAVVAKQAVALKVAPGMTGTAVQEFAAGTVRKPGKYTVELLAAAAGAPAVVAQVPLTITEPVAAAPIVKNLPGEIHHYPADRIDHNAYMEHREGFLKHNFVKGKADYVAYIRKYTEPGLKERCRDDIRTKSKWGYGYALHCLAVYQITQDPEYIQLARDIMDYTLNDSELGWFKVTALCQYRYLTWMKDPNSPFMPKDAEARFRANLAKVAANPTSDLFAESGTHNRVWHRYMLLKIARMVAEQDKKPIDPKVIEYTDYHDKLIGQVGDSDDASAGYHWVFFDAAIGIYFFTGDWDAFRKVTGFRKTLSRYVEMVSPTGACAPFASCSGWPEVGESMWAYELASALYRDGRFRWTSHRIAEYYYNHLDYRANQYHGPFDTARNNFTLSYLFADDTVAPVAPPSASRVTWRHPMEKLSVEETKARPGQWYYRMDAKHWIPDKVVLSSGDQLGLWGLVELLPIAGHGGELPGNIIALQQQDAALFAGQGYYENTPDFQNILWIEDLDGLAADPRMVETTVPIFVDDPAFTYVRIVTTAYQHLPVTYTRDIVFVKNGYLVVKDRVKFDATMKVRVGPCYYARDLGPQSGDNWFNAYYQQLYYTGLGLGRGVQAIENPKLDLLVYYSPRPDYKCTVLDRYLENPYRNSPIQLRQTWSGMVRAGQELTFTSVLLPHEPTVTPKNLLEPPAESKEPKRLEIVRDDNGVTVVKAICDLNPMNKIRYETWVMLNDTGAVQQGGPLASDGLVAVVGHNYDGKIRHRVVVGGKTLTYKDVDETAAARKLPLTTIALPAEYK